MSATPLLTPRLTCAAAPTTREVQALDEFGARRRITIPAERALTVFVDKRELVTLMTLGAAPELLVLGYLRNQRLVDSLAAIESITVDWDVEAAAVRTREGIEHFERRTARRVVTTGCGQGTMFGDLMAEVGSIRLPAADDPRARVSQRALYGLLDAMRLQESTYKSAGSVHGCALFRQAELLTFVEDVGPCNRAWRNWQRGAMRENLPPRNALNTKPTFKPARSSEFFRPSPAVFCPRQTDGRTAATIRPAAREK